MSLSSIVMVIVMGNNGQVAICISAEGVRGIDITKWQIDGLVQERRNSSALAMELHLCCTDSLKLLIISAKWKLVKIDVAVILILIIQPIIHNIAYIMYVHLSWCDKNSDIIWWLFFM